MPGNCAALTHACCQAQEAETEVLNCTPGEPLFPPTEARDLDKQIWSARQIKKAKKKKAAEAMPSRALGGSPTATGFPFPREATQATLQQREWPGARSKLPYCSAARTLTARPCRLRARPDQLARVHSGGDSSRKTGRARFPFHPCRGLGNLFGLFFFL